MIIFKFLYNNHKQKILFLICGGFAALANFFSRIFFSLFLQLPLAILFSFLVGLTCGYFLFNNYVFKSKKVKNMRSPFIFLFVNIIALLQIYLLTIGLSKFFYETFSSEYVALAHGISIITSVFMSYFCHKNFTFK